MRQHFTILDYRFPAPAVGQDMARTALSVWSWSVVVTGVLGCFSAQVPLALLTWPFDKSRTRTGRLVRDIGVLIAKLNPMWDFKVHGELPSYRPSKTVVVSNHVSNSDTFLIAHLPWEMKWLGKASLFKIPIFGWMMWMAGDVPVKRGTKGSIVEAMDHCKKHLARNMPVMFFPEGTRSTDGHMLPFKDGAFRLAIEAGADILPLAVAGTREALPKHSWRFGFSRGLVAMGEPISTDGMTLDDLDDLKEKTRAQIAQMVAVIAPLTADP